MKTMQLEHAQILSNNAINADVFSMTITSPSVASKAKPGQFVMLFLGRGELLLPRPISFCDVNISRGTVTFVYRVVGAGTKVLSEMLPWQNISLIGPLGNGYLVKGRNNVRFSRVALIGGGIGIPPLHFLAKMLATRGTYVDIYLGYTKSPIMIDRFRPLADRLFITTEDGSFGHRGNVLEVFEAQTRAYDEILSCGPSPMLKALAVMAEKMGIPCQLSLEEHMACGLGACMGCAVNVNGQYVRICSEGPVFYSDDIYLGVHGHGK